MEFADFWKSFWSDFLAFWKTQVFWAALMSVLIALWQWHVGKFNENEWDIVGPYLAIIGIFLIGNLGRTIFRAERQTFHKKEYSQKRRMVADIRAENAPVPSKPNIRCRRHYLGNTFVGHPLSGERYLTCSVEIGNEIGTNVGKARDLRAHLVYRDSETKNILKTECPARWDSDSHEYMDIAVGEGCAFVLAIFDKQEMVWRTSLWEGMEMKGSFDIEARILQTDGNSLVETLNFTFRWGGNWSKEPEFNRV